MNKPRIYLASSWRNTFQPLICGQLGMAGFEVYDFRNPPGRTGFAWSAIDPEWQKWDAQQFLEDLDHPLAQAGFGADMGALAACDACVLLLPCGRSAHLELGYAVGAGKYTAALMLGKNEPELMYRMINFATPHYPALVRNLWSRFNNRPKKYKEAS